ncbi:MAG TPA: alanine dehydrogenase [Ignavibacteriales bacterium]|nr:alanine dehydrogenase [Ignavibacteriales bacterium]HRR18617.1 alanine dehydrogenase [Ignavibacteriales bacterium]HRT98258.1 alanine dehydrogenase [Ignavibacteriales bacterium]
MRIGIPKESTIEEKRVGLTPAAVDALVKNGHTVFVETKAGADCHFDDEEYEKAGAKIVYSAEEAFKRANMIVKVAPLSEIEASYMYEGQILFSFLYLMMNKKSIIQKLLENKVTAIGYELILRNGHNTILQSMSEIAGQLSIQVATSLLENSTEVSKGILLGSVPGVKPANVLIIGGGVAGTAAARSALTNGARVTILDTNINRLKELDLMFNKNVTTLISAPMIIQRVSKYADVIIGAVSTNDNNQVPKVLTYQNLNNLKKGTVLIDLAIDRGGCFESSRLTTLTNPYFIEKDIIHYCVPNLPAKVSRTSSIALANNTYEYIFNVADYGIEHQITMNNELTRGICLYNGKCTNETIAKMYNLEFLRLHPFSKN